MHQSLVVVLLVGLATSAFGLDLSHATKRSSEVDARLLNFFSDLYGQVIYPPLNHVVTNLALLGAQLLAGVAENGIPGPGGRTLQPSEAELRGFFGGLWNDAIKPPLENALSGVSLLAAQLFAGIAMNGVNLNIGKRDLSEAEARGLADALDQAINHIYANVIQKPLENAVSSSALLLAQLLAGIGANGVDLSGVIGKRELTDIADVEAELRGIFNTVGSHVLNGLQQVWNNVLQTPLENFVQNGAVVATNFFGNLGVNGVSLGKRSEGGRIPVISDLISHAGGLIQTQVKPALEGAINAAALHLAGVLANFSQNIGR